MANPVITAGATNLGSVAAEADDDFLFSCFVGNPAYTQLNDPESSAMVCLGGTGSGKTAIARMIGRNSSSSASLDLDEVSLTYVSNSTVLRFLHDLNVPLDYFFQALWKHIICLEYIRLRYRVLNEVTSKNMMSRFRHMFQRDARKQKALSYLDKWESKFWISYDESAREII